MLDLSMYESNIILHSLIYLITLPTEMSHHINGGLKKVRTRKHCCDKLKQFGFQRATREEELQKQQLHGASGCLALAFITKGPLSAIHFPTISPPWAAQHPARAGII